MLHRGKKALIPATKFQRVLEMYNTTKILQKQAALSKGDYSGTKVIRNTTTLGLGQRLVSSHILKNNNHWFSYFAVDSFKKTASLHYFTKSFSSSSPFLFAHFPQDCHHDFPPSNMEQVY